MSETSDYFTYREYPVTVYGKTYRIISKPGVFSWDHFDPATELLVKSCEIRPTDTVLDLGCGNGIVGVVAASIAKDGRVYLVDASYPAIEAARRTLAANHCNNAEALISDIASAVYDISFDVVLTNAPSGAGNAVVFQFIADAYRVLKPGGRLYLVGATSRGIETFGYRMEAVFGNVSTVALDKGNRVLLSIKNKPDKNKPDRQDRQDQL